MVRRLPATSDGPLERTVTPPTATGLAGLLGELEWRGILHATTPGLPARLATGRPIAGYNGFDPSADSLHVGHLVPIFGLLRLQRFGGPNIVVAARATSFPAAPGGCTSSCMTATEQSWFERVRAMRASGLSAREFATCRWPSCSAA